LKPDSTHQLHWHEHAGVIAALSAYIFWGLAPIYFKLIQSVAPMEIIAHRILWSIPVLAGFLNAPAIPHGYAAGPIGYPGHLQLADFCLGRDA
jgi:hypothetical protein